MKSFSIRTRGLAIALLFNSVYVSAAEAPEANDVIKHYADMIHIIYSDALHTAEALQIQINHFLAEPSEASLQATREAWKAARVPYLQSEVFRFGNAVIDEWEGQVNSWPLDEGLIDYVDTSQYQSESGNPAAQANVVATTTLKIGTETIDTTKINADLLRKLHEIGGSEANVATGYHAIEFLLWGQDLHGTGPGAGERPYTDYVTTAKNCTNGKIAADSATPCQRRAQYIKTATDLLVSDLQFITDQWAEKGEARQSLLAATAEQGLRTILFGMGSLSLGELGGERIKVALLANSPEDEVDCFSDNTHNAHYYNALGIRNVYLGHYTKTDGTELSGPSLSDLVKQIAPALDIELKEKLNATQQSLQTVVQSAKNGVAFDQLIAYDNPEGRQMLQTVIDSLVAQTKVIETISAALGIADLNPDTADHSF